MNYLSEGYKESALQAFKVFKDIASSVKPKQKSSSPYMGGSISNYTQNLIMSFPILCDDSLPIETASMISRANERHMITLFQLLFASEQLHGTGGIEVLQSIHKNIKSNLSMDDYIDIVDNIGNTLKGFGEAQEIARAERVMTESLKYKRNRLYPTNSFSENSLNDYSVRNDFYGRTMVTEVRPVNYDAGRIDLDDVVHQGSKGDPVEDMKNINTADQIYMRRIQAQQTQARDRESARANREREALQRQQMAQNADQFNRDFALKQQKYDLDAQRYASQQTDNGVEFLEKQLLDTDVKKANEMAPSLMVVKYMVSDQRDPATGFTMEKPFICGVKSRLISTDSMDIVDRLVAKNKTKLSFLNLIRATTGEIGFIKDFLLCIDQAKIDSKNSVKKGPAASMWKTLEYRASKNQKRKLKRAGNDASAITTLVVNQETVNFMKKQYEFDLENIRNTRMIMDSFNFLGIVICDESIQAAKFYYAGNDNYETQAYSYLEKESNDKSYKKVISLISSMNGR